MSKIVTAVNSMISNAEKISDVTRLKLPQEVHEEFVFEYNNKYIWSISKIGGDYSLYYYPENNEVNEIIQYAEYGEIVYITYNTENLKTREAFESFAELYLIVKEKLHNVDGVLDDIIGDLKS